MNRYRFQLMNIFLVGYLKANSIGPARAQVGYLGILGLDLDLYFCRARFLVNTCDLKLPRAEHISDKQIGFLFIIFQS